MEWCVDLDVDLRTPQHRDTFNHYFTWGFEQAPTLFKPTIYTSLTLSFFWYSKSWYHVHIFSKWLKYMFLSHDIFFSRTFDFSFITYWCIGMASSWNDEFCQFQACHATKKKPPTASKHTNKKMNLFSFLDIELKSKWTRFVWVAYEEIGYSIRAPSYIKYTRVLICV